MTTALFTFSLEKVLVAPYINGLTYGAPVTFDSIKSMSLNKKLISDRAQGNSKITALASQAISYDGTLDSAGFQDAAYQVMEGISVTASGGGSVFDESNNLMPYFGVIGQVFPELSDVLIFLPRCKITADITFKLEFGKIVTPQIKFEAIKDDTLGYMMRRFQRASSAAAITFPPTT